ncbi:polyprenyl synthetase family protein [Streptomyces sp. b94]|uniref:polyprenyl synthetase family protein n=1 Tax=Streptomyces sp. b94 TaxID=1827634 RepID=UPI001B36E8A5|nr:polyprenyl synthetase family protein [Streptomyces sp. b94]MBQ1100633.1 polyprenyl synthetase family protein [Streptomyces sp. b94]
MTLNAPTVPFDPAHIRSTVERLLYEFLDQQELAASDVGEVALFTGLLRDMIAAGGKRVRPVLCVTGWQAVRDDPPPPVVYRVAASIELFHAFALIHDDIMDNSGTRRGRPTAHRALATHHKDRPDADALGVNAAILLGDLALGWSYEVLHGSEAAPEALTAVWPVLNAMRTETLTGQYLDLTAAGNATANLETAWRIIRYKTAKYTIERPLHIGAILAGATREQLGALSAYALPLGDAFQLRDDLLGVYGDPGSTGKSSLDDLREGKHTVLIATALHRATPSDRRVLRRLLGDPELDREGAEQIRHILTARGARAAVEDLLTGRCEQALASLDTAPLQPAATARLHHLALSLTRRDG